jgi:hypothetical protein
LQRAPPAQARRAPGVAPGPGTVPPAAGLTPGPPAARPGSVAPVAGSGSVPPAPRAGRGQPHPRGRGRCWLGRQAAGLRVGPGLTAGRPGATSAVTGSAGIVPSAVSLTAPLATRPSTPRPGRIRAGITPRRTSAGPGRPGNPGIAAARPGSRLAAVRPARAWFTPW